MFKTFLALWEAGAVLLLKVVIRPACSDFNWFWEGFAESNFLPVESGYYLFIYMRSRGDLCGRALQWASIMNQTKIIWLSHFKLALASPMNNLAWLVLLIQPAVCVCVFSRKCRANLKGCQSFQTQHVPWLTAWKLKWLWLHIGWLEILFLLACFEDFLFFSSH